MPLPALPIIIDWLLAVLPPRLVWKDVLWAAVVFCRTEDIVILIMELLILRINEKKFETIGLAIFKTSLNLKDREDKE